MENKNLTLKVLKQMENKKPPHFNIKYGLE